MKDFRWKTMGRLGNNLFQFAYLYTQAREGVIPDWYLQDEKFFEEYKSEIKSLLSEGIGKLEYVAIHVRRGDYVSNPFYVDLIADGYYERAMKEFPNEKFLVFSDDIKWCGKQDIFAHCFFSEGYTEEQDINSIASCKGQIISNSSFAWWGAFLSPHKGKVICPKRWYSDGVERTVCPQEWIRL